MREATKEERESINNYIKSISQNMVTIPDGATNGDVIMTMFPNAKELFTNGFERGIRPKGQSWVIWFNLDWWNEPYKGE